MNIEITPEMIAALAALRKEAAYGTNGVVISTVNVLDNAGIFAAIDEATGYDVEPEPERVSKCTCPSGYDFVNGGVSAQHVQGCPGDPAEWGDMAYTAR